MSKEYSDFIVNVLTVKSTVKYEVYDVTLALFKEAKSIMQNLTHELNSNLIEKDSRLSVEFSDRSLYEVEMKVAGDLLIFSMHSNVFEFDRDHPVWSLDYIKDNALNSYCGVINIYNFLADSFKYNRNEDLGYLVARIFVNREGAFWVEGKRQFGFEFNEFGNKKLDAETLTQIIQTSILYSLEFDLLVPPFDDVKIASVAQLNQKIESARMITGKRLGFLYRSDDVGSK
jgi:hypothetical protein